MTTKRPETEENEETEGFDFPKKVEGLFVGLLAFIKAFVTTIWDGAFRPKKFARGLSGSRNDYLKPFTFLTLATFSSVTVTRHVITLFLLALVTFFRGCSSETLLPIEEPTVLELDRLPTVESILLVALPIVLTVVLSAKLADLVVLKQVQRRGVRLLHLIPYVIGIQLIILPVLLGLGFLFFRLWPKIWEHFDYEWGGACLAAIAVIWPLVVLARAAAYLNPKLDLRFTGRWTSRLLFWPVALLVVLVGFGGSSGMAYYLASADVEKVEKKPAALVSISLAAFSVDGPNQPKLTFLAKNNSQEDLWIFATGELQMYFGKSRESFHCTIEEQRDGSALVRMPKGEEMPLVCVVGAPLKAGRKGSALSGHGIYFTAINSLGEEKTVACRIGNQRMTAFVDEFFVSVNGPISQPRIKD